METPDSWKIVKFTSPQHGSVYKVLAGWYGGYANGDAWRLNSGIVSVTETETHYDFLGDSGSIYHCAKVCEHLSGIMASQLDSWKQLAEELVDVTVEPVNYLDYPASQAG